MKNVYDLLFYEKKIIGPYKVFLNAQDRICIGKGKKNEGSGRGWDRKGAERLGKAAQ